MGDFGFTFLSGERKGWNWLIAHDVYVSYYYVCIYSQVADYMANCVKMGQERDRNCIIACEYPAIIRASRKVL